MEGKKFESFAFFSSLSLAVAVFVAVVFLMLLAESLN